MDISPAVSLLIDYNSNFAYRDFSPIRQWISEGCDLERDIVPTMQALMKKKPDINHIAYFRPAIHKARDSRQDTEKALASKGPPPTVQQIELQKAKTYAFLTRKLGRCMPSESRWLASYERVNGEISL